MKKVLFPLFFLLLLCVSFFLSPQETKAQYDQEIKPKCFNQQVPYLLSCNSGGFKCAQNPNNWCIDGNNEDPQCPTDYPIPMSDGWCASCATGYTPNTGNTACVRIASTNPTSTSTPVPQADTPTRCERNGYEQYCIKNHGQGSECVPSNTNGDGCTPPTRCERNGYEQYCIKNHGQGSECVPSNTNGDGCTTPSSNSSQACTNRGGLCSVACNSTDAGGKNTGGQLGDYGCSNTQYCCVPQKKSCDEEKFYIEYKCDTNTKKVCFLDVIRNQKTSCLWNETDAIGGQGYHCDSKYKCEPSCLQKISCYTKREKCVSDAFHERDKCYNDPRKSGVEKETCSDDYIAKIDSCMDDYNNDKCADQVKSCYGDNAVPTQAPAPKPGGGSSPTTPTTRITPTTPPSSQNPGSSKSCPASGDNCTYSDESGACYSGHGPNKGFNVDKCEYSCGPVDCPKSTPAPKKSGQKPAPNCKPGDAINTFNDLPCPKGKKGTCGGHSYCEWHEDGNVETEPICETAADTCYDDNGSSNTSCKDNPVDPPDGYTWKQDCSSSCNSNDTCPTNEKDQSVNPATSNWCYAGKCLMLVSKGGSSSTNNKDKSKDKKKSSDKKTGKDSQNLPGNGKGSKSGNVAKNLSNQPKNSKDKSDRDKAQKPIDKINKDRLAHGLPTLTPLPPDNGAYEASRSETTPTSSPSPTPLPPLDEPGNWQAICGATTNASKPIGIRVSWNAVTGAARYAVRIDEDAPSWEGDNPSPGDTVDNTLTTTSYVRQAKPGAVYQWWVHSVNKDGVYSKLTQKKVIKCPDTTSNNQASKSAGTVGAGELIVLP
jgi:hypothetical protein